MLSYLTFELTYTAAAVSLSRGAADVQNPAIYWRSDYNPSLQRLVLKDCDLRPGAPQKTLSVGAGAWFADAANALV